MVDHCLLEMICYPYKLTSIYLLYDPTTSRILTATVNGEEEMDKVRLFGYLFIYLTTSSHTKCHLFSNWITEYILDEELKDIYPSTWVSLPLHNALMRTSHSPLRFEGSWNVFSALYKFCVTKESMERETENMSFLKGHEHVPRTFPFLGYLHEARDVICTCLAGANLPVSLAGPMFNHTVVHAADHVSTYAVTRYLRVTCWHGKGWREVFRTRMFIEQMVKPMISPLLDNRLCRLTHHPFYRSCYMGLKELDQKYGFEVAESVTASVMY